MRVFVVHFILGFAFLTQIVALGQDSITDLYDQAVAAHDSGDFETAIDLYSQVLTRDEQHANAFWNRANLWPEDMNARALEDYARVIELVPSFDAAYGNYGFSLLLEKRLKEARLASQKANQLDNEVYSWPLNIGHSYFLEGKLDSAKTFYNWAIFRMESREDLESALGDFDMFIKRNWDVTGSDEMKKWVMKAYNGKD